MVRPCSYPASDKLARGDKDKEHAMTATCSLLNVGMHASEVKVGVNYRFDGGAVVY